MPGLAQTHLSSRLRTTRRRRRQLLPLLALASFLQVAVLFVALGGLVFASAPSFACMTDGLVVPPVGPRQSPYLDLSAAFEKGAAACHLATAAEVVPAAVVPAPSDLITPLVQEAQQRRAARAQTEPQFAERVDAGLNEGRINFLVFGYGDTYEPPEPVHFKGSTNIFSLDLRKQTLTSITLNHDIRAPEVERAAQISTPIKIHMAYPNGGFALMRQTVEDATGLSVDFQLTLEDSAIKRAVDDVFGQLPIDAPFQLDARPIFFEGIEYPEHHFPAGPQSLDGLHSLQYVKAVMKGDYDSAKELTVRKQIVAKAMLEAARRESANPVFWTKALQFTGSEVQRRSIGYDFDAPALLFASLRKIYVSGIGSRAIFPNMGRSIYIVDYLSGDGGVEWVTGSLNPIMQRDLANGVYAADNSFSVPKGDADPYATDLVAHYWGSVRDLIRERLGEDE